MKRKLKKITLPVLVGVASFQVSSLFLLGVFAGYILTKYSAGKVGSIEFSFGSYELHLHHWISALLSLAVIYISGAYQVFPLFILGFGGGVVFQGIYSYDDWNRILYKVK